MKTLVTGATGFLGREVVRRLARDGEVVPLGHEHAAGAARAVDLRDADVLRGLLREERPDAVVHLAAYRDPDFCEADPDETRRLNVDPAATFRDALPAETWLLFTSTDYVFGGDRPPYAEDDARDPRNVYGRSKCEAEDNLASRPNTLVLRIPLLVGAGPDAAHSGFLSQIADALRTPGPRTADDVLVRYPTWIRDVAEVIAFLAGRREQGVLHYSGAEAMTRYGAILAAAAVLGRDASHIAPSREVVARPAERPVNSALRTDRIRALGFDRFTPFTEVVRTAVDEVGLG